MRRSVKMLAVSVVAFALLLAAALAACGGETPQEEPTTPAATATGTLDGAALVQDRCTQCHDLARVEGESASAEEWTAIVDNMVARGAQLDDQERQAVIDYLSEQFPD
jgi:mono/diheme cytochrome c family protein